MDKEKLLNVLKDTRSIVSDAAFAGFRWDDGDWADRLFKNQSQLSKAIKELETDQ